MTQITHSLLTLTPALVYLVVGLLVFAEDALFIGFVFPGETAAVLGGVAASQGRVIIWVMPLVVVAAAIIGDSVGYEVGRQAGTRLLDSKILSRRGEQLDKAQEFLRRRGGIAVFLGRFTAFFRAVMPALAGTARMPYRLFLVFNAAGGIVWGVGYVLLGYLAGTSYKAVEATAGRVLAIGTAVLIVAAATAWRIRQHRIHHTPTST